MHLGTLESGVTVFVEPFIEGETWKAVLNTGILETGTGLPKQDLLDLCLSFCHFTLEQSNGQMIVLDIQGVNNTFIDPVICTGVVGAGILDYQLAKMEEEAWKQVSIAYIFFIFHLYHLTLLSNALRSYTRQEGSLRTM